MNQVKPPGVPRRLRSMPWTRGTVGHWLMNDSGGVSTSAILRNAAPRYPGLRLAPTNVLAPVYSPAGTALLFALAGSDYAIEPIADSALKITGEMSISLLWRANSDYTSSQGIVGCGNSGASVCYALVFGGTDNKFTWYQNGGSVDLTSNISISDNLFRRILIVRTGVSGDWTLKLFVGGVLDTVGTTIQTSSAAASQFFTIGRFGNFAGSYMSGAVAECRVWNIGLPDSVALQYSADPYAEFRAPSRFSASVSAPPPSTVTRRLTLLGVGA